MNNFKNIRKTILGAALLIVALFAFGSTASAQSCLTSSATAWKNTAVAAQTGRFTATFDATPSEVNMDGVIGFSLGPATGYSNLAAIVRFSESGVIDVMNATNYSAGVAVRYVAGTKYQFRLVIDLTTRRYSAYVTPAGGTEVLLANDYAFRRPQASISTVNNWGMLAEIGSQTVCNVAVSATPAQPVAPLITSQPASQTVGAGQSATFSTVASGTAPLSYQWRKNGTAISGATSSSYTTPTASTWDNGTQFSVVVSNGVGSTTSNAATLSVTAATSCLTSSPTTWKNTAVAAQTAGFTATFDATPSESNMDGVIGFSRGGATAYWNLAAIVRFSETGVIDAMNSTAYSASTAVGYVPGTKYQFRLVIDLTTRRYSAYVTPAGGTEVLLANNFAFRSPQASISTLNNWGLLAETGALTICNVAVSGTTTPAVAPLITSQPGSRTVVAGQTATFSVAASGTAPLAYQWRKNGAAIGGATSSSYTTPATSTSDSGAQFSVTVSNTSGTATSNNAALTVTPAATTTTMTVSPPSLAFGNVAMGSNSTLPVTITNTGSANGTISNVSIAGPGFNASGVSTGQIIAPGQTATLNVTLSPTASGSVSGSATVTSTATNSPHAIALSGTGVAAASRSVRLSWNASPSLIIGYNTYTSNVPGGPYTKLNPLPVLTTGYTHSTVQSGRTYYYVVTAVNALLMESTRSNEISAFIP